jgi:hypothetical protein
MKTAALISRGLDRVIQFSRKGALKNILLTAADTEDTEYAQSISLRPLRALCASAVN